ncbi:hypothetical protein [Mycobacterium sherrisii]|nr:hypothetical protein [Mycobacterium sherrisii]MEC4761657.1 hypothetical protein [Mycobacterium sherrisii]
MGRLVSQGLAASVECADHPPPVRSYTVAAISNAGHHVLKEICQP